MKKTRLNSMGEITHGPVEVSNESYDGDRFADLVHTVGVKSLVLHYEDGTSVVWER